MYELSKPGRQLYSLVFVVCVCVCEVLLCPEPELQEDVNGETYTSAVSSLVFACGSHSFGSKPLCSQRAQYPSIKEYTLKV